MNVQAAVVRVTGKDSSARGSVMIRMSTKRPKCLETMDCSGKCNGQAKFDCTGVCQGKAKKTIIGGKIVCKRPR